MTTPFQIYIAGIEKDYRGGKATELTYCSSLEIFIESLERGVEASSDSVSYSYEADMMAKQEKETREDRQLLEEITEEYIQLPAWDRLQVRLFIKWLKFRRSLRKMVRSWLLFQWKLDEEIKALIKKRR